MRKILFLFLIIHSDFSFSQHDYSKDFDVVNNYIKNYLIVKPQINEVFAASFTKSFIQTLDPYKLYFNQDEVSQIRSIEKSVIRQTGNLYLNTRQLLIDNYKKSLLSSLTIIDDLNKATIQFDKNDSVPLSFSSDIDDRYYLRDRKERWLAWVKLQVLQKNFNSISDFNRMEHNPDSMKMLFETQKKNILDHESKRIKGILTEDFENFIFYRFLNSYITQFDPHAFYFSEEMFTDFQEQLSSFEFSYGIGITPDKYGKIRISSLVPGSSAWKSGKLNVDDEIVAIETGDQKIVFDENADLSSITNFAKNSKSETLKITVIKENSLKETVTLTKEKIHNDENSVQGFILNGESKTGYIMLPAFYTSWESDKSFGCAQDVAKTIYALKKENIHGLILDLRNNGGGSIKEAIELAGIFIDFGTLSVAENKTGELVSLKDMNRGTMYSGPLAIIVNENSASASEMVAAVLQDYNRAIITGEKTYGKASGQVLIPVANESSKKQGSETLKITTNRYYRVTGNSYQLTGVEPHIVFPGISDPENILESELQGALEKKTITKKIYYTPLSPFPVNTLQEKSLARIKANNKFHQISRVDSIINIFSGEFSFLPVDLKGYKSFIEKRQLLNAEIEKIKFGKSDLFTIENLPGQKEIMKLYKYYFDINEDLKTKIYSDAYIEETYNILKDYMQLLTKQ